MTKAMVMAAALLAAAAIGGCKNRTDVPSGDTYPQHERWWK